MQRSNASPRLGGSNAPLLSGGESPSKREGFFGRAKHHNGDNGRTNLLIMISLGLNVLVVIILLLKFTAFGGSAATEGVTSTQFSTDPSLTPGGDSAALLTAQRELNSLQSSLLATRTELIQAQSNEKRSDEKLKEVQDEYTELKTKYSKLEATAGGKDCPKQDCPKVQCPPCLASSSDSASALTCRDQSRLAADDLARQGSAFDLTSHEVEWKCSEENVKPHGNITFCPETATNEQYFQLTFYDRPGAGSKVAVRKGRPHSPSCTQLPPVDYVFPKKGIQIPVPRTGDVENAAVHWPNLRVATLKDLLVFNMRTPKNLYHFNASFYDYEQESIVSHAARYIPFDQKIRVALDIGSGGGSLGLLLKRRYDIQVVSTVFADWPYCEYITERGNLCMYLDAMEAMPFAKFSYDLIHSSWVFHALLNNQLVHTFLEQNRILRPGGYIWLNGGWSNSQVETMENLFINLLGYSVIYNHKRPVTLGKTKFDTIPYELDWEVILVKPIRADKTCRLAQEAHNPPGSDPHGRSK